MRKAELPALTGIRFYAALAVFLSHVPVIPGMETLSRDALPFKLGVVGVSFFFVLSGFILTYNYADRFREGVTLGNFKHFVWDRFTKIYPVHLSMVLVMIPVQIYSPNLPLDWRAVPFHLLLLQCFWPFPTPPFNSYMNVPSWSISCEWFFYLLAPASIFFVLGRGRYWIPLVAALTYMAGMGYFLSHPDPGDSRFYYTYSFAPSRYIEFLAGLFLGRIFLTMRAEREGALSAVSQIGGLVLLMAGAVYRAYAPWPLQGGLLYIPGSVLLIFGLSLGQGFFVSHLSGARLALLGKASFSFYLIHVPMLRITKGICLRFGWEVRSWTAFTLVALGMFTIIQSAAILTFQWFEMPVQKRLRAIFVQ